MNLKDLAKPFKESEIEWRIGRAGKKGNGQIWAMCLAYVQARAIMDRLDDVCGPQNWKVSYRFISTAQSPTPGVIAEIQIKIGDEWISKEDGAEQTDIESFKGGLSSALKRAAVPWGIGRYLYGLEEGFAQIVDRGGNYGTLSQKDGGTPFYWVPPALPEWALPSGEKSSAPAAVKSPQPSAGDGLPETSYRVTFGKFAKRSLEEIDLNDLRNYVNYLEEKAKKDGKQIQGQVAEFIDRAVSHIAAFESGMSA